MKATILAALAFAACCAGLAAPAGAQALVNGQNPEAVRALFDSWGHEPTPLESTDDQPLFTATVDGFHYFVAFNGCTRGRDCTHVVLVAHYEDVLNAPYEWLNRQNYDFDQITASRNPDSGRLALRSGITLGRQGIPVSTLRMAVDAWVEDTALIAQAAVEAGLSNDAEATRGQ